MAELDVDISLPLSQFVLQARFRSRSPALAVLGPSGAGKTSLLEVLAGLRPRAKGTVRMDGAPLPEDPERRSVGYVPQDALLFPHLTAEDNLRFGLHGRPDADRRLAEVAEMTDVGGLLRQYPHTLSGGERQRVALARALAPQPRLLLLDEPLASLDAELKQRILPYLFRVRDEAKVQLVYVTHHWGEARLLADEALLMRGGTVVAQGSTQEVLSPKALADVGPLPDADNVIRGAWEATKEGPALRVRGGLLWVPTAEAEPKGTATFLVPAEDILLSTRPLEGISARNVFPAAVRDVAAVGTDAWVRFEGCGEEWWARLTPASVRELGLTAGTPAFAAIKAHAFRRLR